MHRTSDEEAGKTVRDGDHTVREDAVAVPAGATVREGAATVRETPSPPASEERIPQQQVGWLPPVLAEKYVAVEDLVGGGESDVFLVEPRDPGDSRRRVAKIYRHGFAPKEDVLNKIMTIHPSHVVEIEGYGQDRDTGRWWELMEYVEEGSLRALIDREGPVLPEELVRIVLSELNDALIEVHGEQMEYRDLKPANVLVRRRDPLDLVLADFGITSAMQGAQHLTRAARTVSYAPPEASGGGKTIVTHTKWDYWSLGMIVLEMLVGHPYEGVDEAVVDAQLRTDIDGLARDVADPAWQKLCRGLLQRKPDARWDGDGITRWMADANDPTLEIADELPRPPSADQPAAAAIDFAGAAYTTPAELGLALSMDWEKAQSFWRRRYGDVVTWVFDGLGNAELGQALQNIDEDDLSLDQQVFSFIYCLAPDAPLRFRDADLSQDSIVALGKKAIDGDRDAQEVLLTLHRMHLDSIAAALPHGAPLADIAHAWDAAAQEFENYRRELGERGRSVPDAEGEQFAHLLGAVVIPPEDSFARDRATAARTSLVRLAERAAGGSEPDSEKLVDLWLERTPTFWAILWKDEGFDVISHRWDAATSEYLDLHYRIESTNGSLALPDDQIGVLLAASLPTAPSQILENLRQRADAACTSLARRCLWFRDLGKPDEMSLAALVLVPWLREPAEQHVRQLRKGMRKWTLRACIAGCVVGWVLSYWAYFEATDRWSAFEFFLCVIVAGLALRWARTGRILTQKDLDEGIKARLRSGASTLFGFSIMYVLVSLLGAFLWDFGIGFVASSVAKPSIAFHEILQSAFGQDIAQLSGLVHAVLGGLVGYCIAMSRFRWS